MLARSTAHALRQRGSQDIAMMSVVHDWHALHRFNIQEERKETAGGV